MVKNIFLLAALCFTAIAFAKHPVAQESMGDAESFKVEQAGPEQEAQRAVAGAKIKKQKKGSPDKPMKSDGPNSDSDSEVRYWQYSE